MFKSNPKPASLPSESHDKHQQVPADKDKAFPLSLTLLPAGLEVVPSSEKHVHEGEKEKAQALPEAISQEGKEVSATWTEQPAAVAPLPDQSGQRRMCGLKPRFFWTIVASSIIAVALIIGLAVGLVLRKS